jgi:hypothetical protein
MKFVVRAGWEEWVEFESDNQDIKYLVVVWANNKREVKGYEAEDAAIRAMNYALKKYDAKGLPASAQFYPAFVKER